MQAASEAACNRWLPLTNSKKICEKANLVWLVSLASAPGNERVGAWKDPRSRNRPEFWPPRRLARGGIQCAVAWHQPRGAGNRNPGRRSFRKRPGLAHPKAGPAV